MIYLKNPLCLGMEESEYKEMLALGGMRQKHFEKNEVILSAGCTTHEIGLVLSGSVNIENLDLWGSKSILSNIGAGLHHNISNIISSFSLLFHRKNAPAKPEHYPSSLLNYLKHLLRHRFLLLLLNLRLRLFEVFHSFQFFLCIIKADMRVHIHRD